MLKNEMTHGNTESYKSVDPPFIVIWHNIVLSIPVMVKQQWIKKGYAFSIFMKLFKYALKAFNYKDQ